MDIRDAYMIMQEASGIKVGDKVKVLRRAKSHELGWFNSWMEEMDCAVGQIAEVLEIDIEDGIKLSIPDRVHHYAYPYYVLDVVEPAPTTIDVTIGGHKTTMTVEEAKNLKSVLNKLEL